MSRGRYFRGKGWKYERGADGLMHPVMSARESRRATARRQAKLRPQLAAAHLVRKADGYCVTCDKPADRVCLPVA